MNNDTREYAEAHIEGINDPRNWPVPEDDEPMYGAVDEFDDDAFDGEPEEFSEGDE